MSDVALVGEHVFKGCLGSKTCVSLCIEQSGAQYEGVAKHKLHFYI